MPDLVQVRFNRHHPTQDYCIKIQLIDAFLNENGPFQKVGANIDSDLFPGILNDGKNGLAAVISTVCDEGELESFPLFGWPCSWV